mgnify:CR=1 FL=1
MDSPLTNFSTISMYQQCFGSSFNYEIAHDKFEKDVHKMWKHIKMGIQRTPWYSTCMSHIYKPCVEQSRPCGLSETWSRSIFLLAWF